MKRSRWLWMTFITDLVGAGAITAHGHVFSEYAKSEIGYDGRKIRVGGMSPLQFAVKEKNGQKYAFGEYKGSILHFDKSKKDPEEGLRIEESGKGVIRLMHGRKCVGVSGNKLIGKKCVFGEEAQKFRWEPIDTDRHGFHRDIQMNDVHSKNIPRHSQYRRNASYPVSHRRSVLKPQVRRQDDEQEEAIGDDSKKTARMIIEVPIQGHQSQVEDEAESRKPLHLGKINASEAGTLVRKLLGSNDVAEESEEEDEGSAKVNSEALDGFLNDFSEISDESEMNSGPNDIQESFVDSDSNSEACECVRNPKNGDSYYALGIDGKMRPIYSLRREARTRQIKNKLGKWLSGLTGEE